MKKPRYVKVKSGQWVQPIERGYMIACCDCALVHRMNFRTVGTIKNRVQFQAYRAIGETKRLRKRDGIRVR